MQRKSQIFKKKSLRTRLRSVLYAAIALFVFGITNVNAAGYVCEDKTYVSCNDGFYFSGYGSSASTLTCNNGGGTLTESPDCLACPTGCTCAGGTACPLCGYKLTLDVQNGTGGTTTIYQSSTDKKFYKDQELTTQMTTSANPITVPTRAGYVFGGYYTSTSGEGTQIISATGYVASDQGSFTADTTLYAKWSTCESGYYCPAGSTSTQANKCPGSMTSAAGSDVIADCKITCDAGYYLKASEGTCSECIGGKYCNGGTYYFKSSNQGITGDVQAGYYSAAGGTSATPTAGGNGCLSGKRCGPCGDGRWSSTGSSSCSNIDAGCYGTSATSSCPAQCGGGKWSDGGDASCSDIAAGYFSTGGGKKEKPTSSDCTSGNTCGACGGGKWSGAGSSSCSDIEAGCYGTSATSSCPAQCEAGTYSTAGKASCTDCPGGTYGATKGLKTAACSGDCEAGYYCPAKSTSKQQNACQAGNYCPAKSASQTDCGGDLTSNAKAKAQTECYLTCEKGTYLPKSNKSCATCLQNNYCTGGTAELKYNTTSDQGIQACPSGTSESGSDEESDCKITVTLNKNGGSSDSCVGYSSGTGNITISCSYNVDCNLPSWSSCNFKKSGSIFQNWGTASTSTSGGVTKQKFTSSTTLYAIWNEATCNITNGTANKSVENNATVCDVTCNTGYNVSGTYKSNEGESTYSYKCEQIEYNITYANGGGSGNAPTTPTKCQYGASNCKAPANTYTKTGYTFAGWKCTGGTSSACNGHTIQAGADASQLSVTQNGTVTLTATWTPNTYKVKYSCGDGATGTPPSTQTATYDKEFTVSGNTGCEKQGFHFLHWTYNGKNYKHNDSAKNLTDVSGGEITLTAAYEPDKVGCPSGKTFDNSAIQCVPCTAGYYCTAWCWKDGMGNCDYKEDSSKYSDSISSHKTQCPSNTTSDEGQSTVAGCYAGEDTTFKDNYNSFKLPGIKSYIYMSQ